MSVRCRRRRRVGASTALTTTAVTAPAASDANKDVHMVEDDTDWRDSKYDA